MIWIVSLTSLFLKGPCSACVRLPSRPYPSAPQADFGASRVRFSEDLVDQTDLLARFCIDLEIHNLFYSEQNIFEAFDGREYAINICSGLTNTMIIRLEYTTDQLH